MSEQSQPELLREQLDYYRARAPEYDDWFYRRGRYQLPSDRLQQWQAEVRQLEQWLDELSPFGDTLELAAGTGLWTRILATRASTLTVLDASAEMININRAGLQGHSGCAVHFQEQDLFDWTADSEYDLVVAGFWLSHVPPDRLPDFLLQVRQATRGNGRVFFFDGQHNISSVARDHQLEPETSLTQQRRLNDGREFRVVKVFYSPEELVRAFAEAGLSVQVRSTGEFFWCALTARD